MTRITLAELEPDTAKELERQLTELGNEVSITDYEHTLENYEKFLPDMILLDFTDISQASAISEKILEFDHTACIFALVEETTPKLYDGLYKDGVRVIISSPAPNNLSSFVDELYTACNDLDHENCIGCWKTNRFENLSKLM